MSSISIQFAHPWFLLLLIPGLVLAFWPFFRLKKNKRRNRNRITSLVLHVIVLTLCTLVLSGFTIKEEASLKKKETFIVVDVSRSIENQSDGIDKFVSSLLADVDGNNKVGIVTFSDGAAVASELSTSTAGALDALRSARNRGAGKATDINEALTFTASRFTNKNNAKIILLTDGLDTENNLIIYSNNVEDVYDTDTETVLKTARALSNQGISVDTVYFEPVRYDRDMQINKIEFRKSVLPLDVIDITVTVQSHVNATATLKLYDREENGEFRLKDTISYDMAEGINSAIKFTDFSFGTPGLHTLKVELSGYSGDQIEENNVYYSYVNIETDKQILIIDGDGTQSTKMALMLNEMGYSVTVRTPSNVPANASELTRYNEIILMNACLPTADNASSYETLPSGYDKVLETYVHDYGGGLLTTGGDRTYYFGGMDGTAFDSFLPINVIPEENEKSAIMFLVDASGSMYYDANSTSSSTYYEGSSKYESTRMYYAKQALIDAAMTIFNKKDYIGIMHFGKNSPGAVTDLSLTPASQRGSIISAVEAIRTIEGSRFQPAFDSAVQQLRSTSYKVDKKHIILITDSDDAHATDTFSTLKANIASYKENYDITVSVIAIKSDMEADLRGMTTAVDKNGNLRFYSVATADEIYQAITDECKAATTETMNVSEFGYETYIEAISPITSGIVDATKLPHQGGVLPKVSQYNGFTVKSNALEVLSAYNDENSNYDSLYAYWTYGKGHVGSFASALGGATDNAWASSYFDDAEARQILKNAVMELLPEDSIKSSMAVEYVKKNFTTEVYVTGDLDGGNNAVFITMTAPDGKETVFNDALKVTGNNECVATIENTVEGIYKLYLEKEDAYGNVIDEATVYYTFSYSQEYNTFVGDDQELLEFLSNLSTQGGGNMLSLSDFEYNHSLEYVTVVHDPKLILSIIAIILFILDIIARKFNFKWPHEWFKKKQTEQ